MRLTAVLIATLISWTAFAEPGVFPWHINFGEVQIDQSAQRPIQITNNSRNRALSFSLQSNCREDFLIYAFTCQRPLPPQRSCEVFIEYIPRSFKTRQCWLQFNFVEIGKPSLTSVKRVPVRGRGVPLGPLQ